MREKILLYSNLPKSGGVSTHICGLAQFLVGAGADVWIASLGRDLFEAKAVWFAELGVRPLTTDIASGVPGYRKQFYALRKWFRVLPRRSFDAVVGFGPGGFFGLLAPMKRPGGMVIYNEVNIGERVPAGIVGVPHQLMLRYVDGVGCLSESIVKAFRANHSIGAPVRVLPFFTLGPGRPLVGRPAFGPSDRPVRLGYFGRFEPYKQPELLLDIWKQLDIGLASLTFYGWGSLEGALRAQIVDKGLSASVRVHGAYEQEDLGRLMSQCDLLVMPSKSEGFGLVLLEALANGVPFVTTANGGAADLAGKSPYLRAVEPVPLQFVSAIRDLVCALRTGIVEPESLCALYERMYGYEAVAAVWRRALFEREAFWKEG